MYFVGNDSRILPLKTVIAVISKTHEDWFAFNNSLI